MQSELYKILSVHAKAQRFEGGAAVIIDVRTGELLALVSFPEYNNQGLTDGISSVVRAASTDERKPLLNRLLAVYMRPIYRCRSRRRRSKRGPYRAGERNSFDRRDFNT